MISLAGTSRPDEPVAAEPIDRPLSHGQQALWLLQRLAPANVAYVIAGAARVRGRLDGAALGAALADLAARHEALRTTFHDGPDGPLLRVHAALEPEIVDWRQDRRQAVSDDKDGAAAAEEWSAFAFRPFDLERGPLVRLGVFEEAGAGTVLVLAVHHIVADFWSLGVMVRELGALYGERAGAAGPAPLPDLALGPVAWDEERRARLAGGEGERLAGAWQQALAGVPLVLDLPTDRPRPAVQSYTGASVAWGLEADLAAAVARFGRRHGATLATTLLAGFQALLARWTGQERLVVGVPTTGRRSREVAGLVGYLVNPVPVPADLRGRPGFGELLARVRESAQAAFDRQDYPFALLTERLQPEREPSRSPVFQAMFVLQKGRKAGEEAIAALSVGAVGAVGGSASAGAAPVLQAGPLALEPVALPDPGAQLDLSLALAEVGGQIAGRWQVNSDLFDRVTAVRWGSQLRRLLALGVEAPEVPVGELALLDAAERHQVLVEWNAPAAAAPASTMELLHAGFLAQARRAPGALALVAGEERLTYGELEARSARLAERLRGVGVGPEVRVGVLCGRDADLVVALLGVLRAGGAYVPLDPAYPEERLGFLLADSAAPVVLVQAGLRGLLGGYGGLVVEVAPARAEASSAPTFREAPVVTPGMAPVATSGVAPVTTSSVAPVATSGVAPVTTSSVAPVATPGVAPVATSRVTPVAVTPGNLSHVIYTSGSTGRPKGVAIEHRAAAAFVRWALGAFSREELAGVLAATSVCFDLSVFELFAPLSAGGTVVLAANALALPELPAADAELVTLVNTVPSAMAELVRARALPDSVLTVNLAGEPLPRSLADGIYAASRVRRVVNLYGPTEDTTYSTVQEVRPAPPGGAEPAIGRPIAGGRAVVLSRDGVAVPRGAVGELCLGGEGLARGYLGRPDLTAERFLPDGQGDDGPGRRLYRTGDLVRQLADGSLLYLGRIDHQVKVRGFRIELGEVEAALRALPGVREAVVVVRDEPAGRGLAAYLAGDGLVDGAAAGFDPAPGSDHSAGSAGFDPAEAAAAAEGLRAALAARLPAYMVPAWLVVLPALPLTPNGKVDRRALPAPLGSPHAGPGSAAGRPRTPTEELLAGIWADLLGLPATAEIAPHQSFFHLGGHSLLAARALSRVREALGVDLGLARFFEAPTLAALAVEVDRRRRELAGGAPPAPPLVPAPRGTGDGQTTAPLSPAQERLWFLDQLEPDSAAYNIPGAVRLGGALDVPALAAALAAIVARHEALRTRFGVAAGRPVQVIRPPAPAAGGGPALPVIDLAGLGTAAREAELLRLAAAEAARPFDLAAGPLLRCRLVRLAGGPLPSAASGGAAFSGRESEGLKSLARKAVPAGREASWPSPERAGRPSGTSFASERFQSLAAVGAPPPTTTMAAEHALLVTLHHIVSDGWSLGVLVRELGAFYGAARADRSAADAGLPPLALQYADYAVWQRRWLEEEGELERQLGYWRTALAGAPALLDLPLDRPRSGAGSAGFQPATSQDRKESRQDAGAPSKEGRQDDGASRQARGARLTLCLSPAETQAAAAFARASGATPFLVLLAALDALLLRHSGQEDLVVGSPVAGRDRLELEPLIGLFVNTLVLRCDAGGDPTARTLLARVRTAALAAWAHQDVPFDRLVEALAPQREAAHTPLFQVLLAPQPDLAGDFGGLVHAGLALAPLAVPAASAKLDLAVGVAEQPDGGLALHWVYRTALFDAPTVARLAAGFGRLLAAAAAAPARRLSELPLLAAAERHQLLHEWDQLEPAAPAAAPLVHDLIAAWARRRPGAPALERPGPGPQPAEIEVRTYAELDAAAGRLALRLRALGIGPEDRVGLFLERSFEAIESLLAVLRVGAAYLPLDPALPADRLAFLLADARPAAVLTVAPLAARLPALPALTALTVLSPLPLLPAGDPAAPAAAAAPAPLLVRLDDGWTPAGEPACDLPAPPDPPDPQAAAYVIYTSGSTGRAKGVVVSHGALARRIRAQVAGLGAPVRFLHKTTLGFDASVGEVFGALAAGGTLVLAAPGGERDQGYLVRLIREREITHASFTASTLAALVEHPGFGGCRSLRLVLTGAETVPAGLPARFAARLDAELHNRYGPTETTVSVISGCCAGGGAPVGPAGPVPLGRPIPGAEILLLDRAGNPVPARALGEIHVGGGYLARGYLDRPDLTAERFVPHPWGAAGGERLYRTGDLARFHADGRVEFAGRADQQVKVRGFRVEPGEIESVLAAHPGVRAAAVAARARGAGQPADLVAYVVPAGDPAAVATTAGSLLRELRAFARERLPAYMVPAAFVPLARLPLSPAGKVDRGALPAPPAPGSSDAAEADDSLFEAPGTEFEEALAAIWREVLEVERIGVQDRFFDLGGHSLQVTRVLLRVEDLFGVEVGVRRFFETPTIAGLALAVAEKLVAEAGPEVSDLLAALQPEPGQVRLPSYMVASPTLDGLSPAIADMEVAD